MRRIGYAILVAYLAGAGVDVADHAISTGEVGPARSRSRASGRASRGYVLFSPLLSTTTYLIDTGGRVVHTWESDFAPGASVYLLDNGHLLRPARDPALPFFSGGGQGGRIQEFTWEGERVWDFLVGSHQRMPHHDMAPLPKGNVLAIVWERKSRQDALRAGRMPELVTDAGLWPDAVLEIAPRPPTGGEVVWEWHAFLHTNSIAYNPSLDQIVLSVLRFNELWVIAHDTTTVEAAGHSGGRAGRGGDLLYRWGNPRAYGRGSAEHQQLFGQHDARWIPAGFPGGGNLMVFDNGDGRPGGAYSAVVEITPPLAGDGSYSLPSRAAFGPVRPTWRYTAPNRWDFFADFVSGAHRLPNGNTFICSGPTGHFFEVTPQGDTVWEYINPFSGDAPNPAGDPPHSVFRATHIPPDHPALAGRTLRPLDPVPSQ